MIRQPTPIDDQLAWHRAALADRSTPRHDSDPQCGWYRMQARRGAPFAPVLVWLDQQIDADTGELMADERIRASTLGKDIDPVKVWTYLTPISRDAYLSLVALHRRHGFMASTEALDPSLHVPEIERELQ